MKRSAESLLAAEEPGASEVLELPSGWTPGDLGPTAWYYADLQYVTTAADGVSAWADRSGSGHHVVQVASGYRPQFQPAGWNGNRPTLAFNGTTAFLRDNGWASGSPVGSEEPFTVLAVVEPSAIQRGGLASWYGTYGGGWIATRLVTPDGISLFGEIRRQGTDHLYWVGNDTYTFTGSTNVGTGRHVLAYRFSNGRLKITVDAGTDAEQAPHAPLSPLGGTEFLIGREDTFYANDYAGKLSELVVVPRELTDADVQTFREYARKQWGGLIGPNHARGESAGRPPPSMPRPAPYVGPVVGDDDGAALLDELMATLTASEVEILRSGEPLAWDVEEVAESPPPLPYDTRLCANWNASYVDGDLGEDDGGTPAPDGAPFKRYPASYARFRLLTFGPLAPPQVEHYWLDADGCWTIDPARLTFDPAAEPGTQGSLTLVMVLEPNDLPDFGPGFLRPDDEFENDADEVGMAYSIAGDGAWLPRAAFGTDVPGSVPFETWTQAGIWAQPPEVVDLRAPAEFMNPIQNIAATVSTLLTTPDLGLVPFQYQISQGTGTFFHDAFRNFVFESSGGNPVRFAPPQPARNLDECSLSDISCPDTMQTCIDLVTRQACASETGCGCFPSLFEVTIPNATCLSSSDCAATQDCFRDNAAFAAGAISCDTSCLLTPCNGAQGCRCMTTCETDLNCQPDEGCFDATSFGPCSGGRCLCMKQDNTRWKMILAHELGHQVQHLGIGPGDLSGENSYQFCSDAMCSNKINDPPGIATESPLCACNHVRAANATHCLQSIETTGDAQTEGFAQFFAARVWNDATEPDCTFIYYKEFLGADGITQPPPVALDCASPHKWRNSHCNMAANADMATELDWLGFLYSLNSLGPEATQVPMTDLWKIYRNACVPPGTSPNPDPPACMNNIPMQWQLTGIASDPPRACSATVACAPSTFTCLDASPGSMVPCPANGTCVCKVIRQGFVEGAIGTFGLGSAEEQNVRDLGLTFGVDRNLAP